MKLELEIREPAMQIAIKDGAEAAGMDETEFVMNLLNYSFNTSAALLAVEQLTNIVNGELMERVIQNQLNTYAMRHQITNLHADLLGENDERALEIAAEANVLAEQAVFEDDDTQEE